MVFRSQEIRERCSLCEEPSAGQCPKCQVSICQAHRGRLMECCSSCSAEMDLALSRAGYGKRGLGAALVLCSTVLFYAVAALHMLTPAIGALFIAGGGSGVGLLGWSFGMSRRLARRRLEQQLGERKLLAAPRASAADEPP